MQTTEEPGVTRSVRTKHVQARVLRRQLHEVDAGGQGAQKEVRVRDGGAQKDGAARQQVPVLGRPRARFQVQQVPVLAPVLPSCVA